MGIAHNRRKAKGTSAERELIKQFWSVGWAAFRAAGSGSMNLPCPDLIAGNKLRKLAIEVKTFAGTRKYFSREEIEGLLQFATLFGAEPWVAIRFDNRGWYFLTLEDLVETSKSYAIDLISAQRRGLSFAELTNAFSS